jgi:hypothetical protein
MLGFVEELPTLENSLIKPTKLKFSSRVSFVGRLLLQASFAQPFTPCCPELEVPSSYPSGPICARWC